jgi:hypothetical protein
MGTLRASNISYSIYVNAIRFLRVFLWNFSEEDSHS